MADHRASRKARKERIRSTPLTETDDLGYVSPKSAGLKSPDHISPISSPTLTDTQMKWARRSLPSYDELGVENLSEELGVMG